MRKERWHWWRNVATVTSIASGRGMEYIMVMKCSDSGYIHVEPLATRNSKEMTTAFERGVKFFRSFDRVHLHVRLDNETSVTLKESFKNLSIAAEYVAPSNHRQNAAERDIRTFKNHFIATLATADPCFPLDEWDLILLRKSGSVVKHYHRSTKVYASPEGDPGSKPALHLSREPRRSSKKVDTHHIKNAH
jgi:hypothetical protein